MVSVSCGKVHDVKIALSTRAYLLLKEEYPNSVQYIYKHDDEKYTWIFDANVYNQGVSRFVMGLLDEVKVLEGVKLKEYVKEKIRFKVPSYHTLKHWKHNDK